MYTRRDVFKLIAVGAAIAAAPELALGKTPTTLAVLAPDGDILPLDGSWFDVRDFPELAEHFREATRSFNKVEAWFRPHHPRVDLGQETKGHLMRLPKVVPYASRAGLDLEGRQIWKTTHHYIRVRHPEDLATGERPEEWAHRCRTSEFDSLSARSVTFLGNKVEVIGYTLYPEMGPT